MWAKERKNLNTPFPGHKVLDSHGRLPLQHLSHLAEGEQVMRVLHFKPGSANPELRAVKVYTFIPGW